MKTIVVTEELKTPWYKIVFRFIRLIPKRVEAKISLSIDLYSEGFRKGDIIEFEPTFKQYKRIKIVKL